MTTTAAEAPLRTYGRSTLSQRETEIVDLACQGCTDKEIALELGIRFTSVKSHWARIRRKCGASNRAQVISLHTQRNFGSVERAATEQAWEFQRLRAYWNTLLSQIPLLVAVLDEEGRFQWCGHRDYPELVEGLVGRLWPDTVAHDDRQAWEVALRRALEDGQTSEFTATLMVCGRLLSVSGYAHPIEEGGHRIGVLAVGTLRAQTAPGRGPR